MRTKFLSAVFAVVVLFVSNSIQAEDGSPSGEVSLNINLHPIQTLVINQKTVDIDYKTKDDYLKGVKVNEADHLTVYSTGGFEVKAKTATDYLVGSLNHIDTKDVTITPSNGSNALSGAIYTARALSKEDQVIVSSTTGGVDKTVNVEYQAFGGGNSYVNYYQKTESPTIFTTTVTYTIVAK
ncbi:MAG: hypothetical protein ACK5MK_15710 [Dysgonomonas sp.]